MANKYYQLIHSSWSTQMVSALNEKYGAGITIHFSDSNNIIFTCAAICNKVIKISITRYTGNSDTYDKLSGYFGDAWTTGSTITNSKTFANWDIVGGYNSRSWLFAIEDLILGDDFLLISSDGPAPQMLLIGKLTNGKYITYGAIMSTLNLTSFHGWLTDYIVGDPDIEIITLNTLVKDDGKFVIHPILFSKGGNILKNSDGSYATINKLFNVAYDKYTIAPSFYVTRSKTYYNATGTGQIITSLFCELAGV